MDLSFGVPKQNCLESIKNEIGINTTYIGITGVVTSLIMIALWVFQYCLWKDYGDEDKCEYDK